jgi:ATP-dependent DNA helicase MPH1
MALSTRRRMTLTRQTINDFKQGIHNILVSTSIGEEGLDIGEVDFVVIYDMPKQSIKLVRPISMHATVRDLER